MTDVVLYDYWRSSACYRVRIALNLLGIDYQARVTSLLDQSHKSEDYMQVNPQGLIPTLEIDGKTITQSLAIIEYLDETRDQAGFLPRDLDGRSRVRTLSYAIAMEIHPLCNLRSVNHVVDLVDGDDETRFAWMRKFIGEGLTAVEALLNHLDTGTFCHGDAPSMADLCLVPQLYNADRWSVDYSHLPQIMRISRTCRDMKAFQDADPDVVKAAAS